MGLGHFGTKAKGDIQVGKQPSRSENSILLFQDIVGRAKSLGEINGFLSFIARPPRYALFRQFILFHKGSIIETLEKKFSWTYPQFQVVNPQARGIRLQKSVGRQEPRDVHGYIVILPGSQQNIYRLISISYADFWNNVVVRFVRQSYPEMMPTFFKQNEIKESLLLLEQNLGADYRIRITEVTTKEERPQQNSKRIRKYDTERRWTGLSIEDVFDQALERGQWFTSIRYSIQRRNPKTDAYAKIASGRIHRRGEIYYDYLHDEISEYLIEVLETQASERLNLYSGRGIKERDYQAGLPLEILYKRDIFSETSEIVRFGEVIHSYPHATKAVYHSNPYYHASIADFLDGSSFDVWVLSPRRVVIVPQAKSTEQSLERLVSHIFVDFKEGTIGEYSGSNGRR